MEPAELLATGWPEQVNGCIVTPEGVSGICDQGQCRLIDYTVVATEMAQRVEVSKQLDSFPRLAASTELAYLTAPQTIGNAAPREVIENVARNILRRPLSNVHPPSFAPQPD